MLQQVAALLGQHFEMLLLLYWSLASAASTVALLPVPGAAGFRCAAGGGQPQPCGALAVLAVSIMREVIAKMTHL